MKLLKNERDYKSWMLNDYLQEEETLESALSADELRGELARYMPAEFPCIACTVADDDAFSRGQPVFYSRKTIMQWSAAMGMAA